MRIFKKRKERQETAVTVVEPVRERKEEPEEDREEPKRQPVKKKSIFNQIGEVMDVAKGFKSSFDEVYYTWVKPIMDNRAQIKRRWNALVTAISVVFFLLYVPILLFLKIVKGLSLGWDIALYTSIGVYLAAVIVMIAVTVVSGKSTSTQASKRWRRVSGITLFIVRIASFALSVTAILVSGSGDSHALDILLMVFAVTSIVFTSLSLVFGGAVGFFKWLISPAKIKRSFSFVALEWKQTVDEGKREQSRAVKKSYAKYRDKIAACLDDYLLPAFGKAYIGTIDGDKIIYVVGNLPEEDRNLTEWVIKDIFDYAQACGYVAQNPCEELELEGDVAQEKPPKPPKTENDGVLGKVTSFLKRK